MKKRILTIALTVCLLLNGLILAVAQDQPKPKKDTVNIDTDAKPTFYYAVEDEKSADKSKGSLTVTIIIVAAAVVVVGAGAAFLLKKKK